MGFWERLGADYAERTRSLRHFWDELPLRLRTRDFYHEVLDGLYHALIVGPTGMGKSKLIEALIRYLILEGDCVVFLLDPGGQTAREVESWALQEGLIDETLILDPEESQFYLGFNPLAEVPGLPLSLQAKFLQEAIFSALRIDQKGRESIFYAPMLKQCLYFLVHLLMEAKLTFEEVPCLLSVQPNGAARAIIERAETPEVRDFWFDLQKLKPNQRQQILGLLQAELLSFITSEPIKRMMGQRERVVDFSNFIEEGRLFLANLEAGSSLTNLDSKLLTNLLISSIVRACFARDAYQGREVFLILEEAGEVEFSSDIGTILRRARKQRLKTILLNQDLSSMIEANPKIFSMIWANANHKIAFGDLPMRDLEILALEFYGEELNLKEIKDEIETVYFEPKETRRTVYSSMDSYSEAEGEVGGSSFTEVFGGEMIRFSESQSTGGSKGFAYGEVTGESVIPFYEYLKRKQVTSREFWPLEEQLHRAMVRLKGLPKATIALKRRGRPVEILKVPYIPDLPPPKDFKELRLKIFRGSGYYVTIDEIKREEERREEGLDHGEDPKEF